MQNVRNPRQVIDLYGFFAPIRVNPVILYERTVILGPKNPKGQLRISEKKIRKKNRGKLGKIFPFPEKLKKIQKYFLVRLAQIF